MNPFECICSVNLAIKIHWYLNFEVSNHHWDLSHEIALTALPKLRDALVQTQSIRAVYASSHFKREIMPMDTPCSHAHFFSKTSRKNKKQMTEWNKNFNGVSNTFSFLDDYFSHFTVPGQQLCKNPSDFKYKPNSNFCLQTSHRKIITCFRMIMDKSVKHLSQKLWRPLLVCLPCDQVRNWTLQNCTSRDPNFALASVSQVTGNRLGG